MNSSRYPALIFDFDGLILDTETASAQAWIDVFGRHGVPVEPRRLHQKIGLSSGHPLWWDPAQELAIAVGSVDAVQILDEKMTLHRELLEGVAPNPGVVELLAECSSNGVDTAIASSSPASWVKGHLERLELTDHFRTMVCGDGQLPPKPDPALYCAAIAELGVGPSQAVALEDSAHGVAAAIAAGLRVLAVPHYLCAEVDYTHATRVVESLAGLTLSELARL